VGPGAPGTILIVTHEADDHVPLVASELAARGVPVVRFDTESYPERSAVELRVDARSSVRLRVAGEELDGESVAGVLYRHLRLPAAPRIDDEVGRRLAESELRAALEGALLSLDAYWLNHPQANRLSRHKPLQLTLAAAEGFSVPETRITADPEEVRSLFRAWDGRMVAKLVGGQVVAPSAEDQYVIYTTLLSEDDLASDAALTACPAIYQRYVEKLFELRVTVVGDEVFACRIDSQAHEDGRVDWRRAGRDALALSEHRLDPSVARMCVSLARRLNLELAGLDLIETPEGETVFLELNAAGQWAWVEHATGMPIAAAVADRLISGSRGRGPARFPAPA
jgi:glutathione synthase/RimK-type ligase-like ATP-grasp enzyme